MDMGKFCLKSIETVHLRTIQLDSALHTHTEKEKRKKNTKKTTTQRQKIVSEDRSP